jgi:hypothetical protein
MIRYLVTAGMALLCAVSLAACAGKSSNVTTQSAGSSAAPPTGASTVVLVTSGTTVKTRLQQEISSKKNHDGDKFTLVVQNSSKNPSLNGAVIDGHLDNVTAAGMGRKPAMTIVFDDIRTPDGTTAPVDVQIVNSNAFNAKSHHLRTIGMMIGGGIAGHMAAGKHHGGLAGTAGGYALSQQMKTDVDVKRGTVIVVRFKNDATAQKQNS